MDDFSCLGPIDPQIESGGRVVPALSYLHQYKRLIEESRDRELTAPEMMLLDKLDLAELHRIELAAELSVSLIEEWLSKYKFKDWKKGGKPVSDKTKRGRAKEIAQKLNDHKKWRSHGHGIHKDVLENDLNLRIDDYGAQPDLRALIAYYFWPAREFAARHQLESFVQSRRFL